MKVLRWLDKHFEECIMFLALWMVVCISFLQIIMRYAAKSSLAWPEELNRYLFIWFAYVALGYAVRHSCHTRIDIFETLIPRLKKPLSYVCDLGLLFFAIYMLKPGYNVVLQLFQSHQTSSALNLPMYLVYLSLFTGLILTILRLVQKYVLKLLALKQRKEGTAP